MSRILLLHTGGTLGMSGRRPQALRPAAFLRTLRTRVPELAQLARLEVELFSNLDSCEMQPELWSKLAARIHQQRSELDGVVITHGTDTLAYTASALSFMLVNLPIPVVLTGSQRPLGELRSDARLNLIDAVTAATRGPPEVTVCFDSHLYRGNRTVKVKVAEYDAFESPNLAPLGTLGVEVRFERGLRPAGAAKLQERIDPRVFLLKVFPGLDPQAPLALLDRVKGLVVEAYGAGNFPVDPQLGRSLRPLLAEAADRQIPVVIVSQALRNGVDLSLYESGAAAVAEGAISGGDMTSACAVVKLMHALANYRTAEQRRRYLLRPVAGERTA